MNIKRLVRLYPFHNIELRNLTSYYLGCGMWISRTSLTLLREHLQIDNERVRVLKIEGTIITVGGYDVKENN